VPEPERLEVQQQLCESRHVLPSESSSLIQFSMKKVQEPDSYPRLERVRSNIDLKLLAEDCVPGQNITIDTPQFNLQLEAFIKETKAKRIQRAYKCYLSEKQQQ
jgi:hypothetical protein